MIKYRIQIEAVDVTGLYEAVLALSGQIFEPNRIEPLSQDRANYKVTAERISDE